MSTRLPASVLTLPAGLLAVAGVLSLVLPAAGGQAGEARQTAANARPRGSPFPRLLTIFDRQGNVVTTLGEPDVYQQPMFSPDGRRLAVVKLDPQTRSQDVWLFDVSSGTSTQFTSDRGLESAPLWSADGTHIIYDLLGPSYSTIYRKAAVGAGADELIFRNELGVTMGLTDWTADGRYLSFTSGGVLFVLPVGAAPAERKPVELLRDEFSINGARFSPDNRFVAFRSDESGRNEIYVRTFDPASAALGSTGKWRVSDGGGLGMIDWRRDGKELFYLAADGGVMAVSITTSPEFKAESPVRLFAAPATIPLTGTPGGLADVSRDGDRFVFAVPTPPQRVEVAVAPEILAKYAGTYAGPGGNDAVVTFDGDRLMIQPTPGSGMFLLYAGSPTSFFFKTAEPEVEFVTDEKGTVTHFVLYQAGRTTRAIRK